MALFLPVLIWNAGHDWASFRFQLVRATATHELSLRTVGDFIGLQFGLVGFILLPVVLSGVALTAWRGYRRGDAVAILLSTSVIVPFGYFFWKSLSLRVGDTWPMFMWPAGFAAAAINIAMLPREGFPAWMIKSTISWANAAIASGIVFVVLVFLYYVVSPWNFIGKTDPVGGEAGYEQVVDRAQAELQKTGATWIATTDYRTYAMLRWYFNGRVPVIQINERGRFLGFRDPGMDLIQGPHRALCRARARQYQPVMGVHDGDQEPLERVDRSWRGIVMDTYALEKLTGWTPELSPPPDSPLYRWRVLAGDGGPNLGEGRRMRVTPALRHGLHRPPPVYYALAVETRCDNHHSSPSRLRSRSLARSPSAGRGRAVNGSGRVTSMAASPSRAVSSPLRTPSPSRCDSFAAMPWPSTCWTRLSLAAMPPVMATWAMT